MFAYMEIYTYRYVYIVIFHMRNLRFVLRYAYAAAASAAQSRRTPADRFYIAVAVINAVIIEIQAGRQTDASVANMYNHLTVVATKCKHFTPPLLPLTSYTLLLHVVILVLIDLLWRY